MRPCPCVSQTPKMPMPSSTTPWPTISRCTQEGSTLKESERVSLSEELAAAQARLSEVELALEQAESAQSAMTELVESEKQLSASHPLS